LREGIEEARAVLLLHGIRLEQFRLPDEPVAGTLETNVPRQTRLNSGPVDRKILRRIIDGIGPKILNLPGSVVRTDRSEHAV